MPRNGTPPHVRRRRLARLRSLRQRGYERYADYLTSPHWATVKARYRASDLPQECICGTDERLQMHHKTYERIGAERLTDLIPLCPSCHAMVHELERRGELALDLAGFQSFERAAAYRVGEDARVEGIAVEKAEREQSERDRPFCDRLAAALAEAHALGITLRRDLARLDAALVKLERRIEREKQQRA